MIKRLILCLFVLASTALCAEEPEDENVLIVCENGYEMFEWDLEFLKHATQSIEISGSYCGGKVFRDLLDVIEERILACPSLQAHILSSPVVLQTEDEERVRVLEEKYPENFHFQLYVNVLMLSPEWSNIENHMKCVVVDEHYFSTGGTNLVAFMCSDGKYTPPRDIRNGVVEKNFPAAYRDGDVVGRGPLAKEIRRLFFNDYAVWEDYFSKKCSNFISDPEFFADKSRLFPIDRSELPFVASFEEHPAKLELSAVKPLFSGPHQTVNVITKEYEKLIHEAKEEIWISNVYFFPFGNILDELKGAVNRGVHLNLITNGIHDLSPEINGMFAWGNRMNYVPVFYGRDFHFWDYGKVSSSPLRNTEIYEYAVYDVMYHKKVMVVDNRFTIVGSYNLGMKSHTSDYEFVLVIDSPEFAASMKQVLSTDRALARPVTPEEAIGWYFNPITSYIGGTQRQFHGFI